MSVATPDTAHGCRSGRSGVASAVQGPNSRIRHYHRVNEDRPHELWNNPSPPVTYSTKSFTTPKAEFSPQTIHTRFLKNAPSEIPMNPSSMSRRHWIGAGLATCGYLAAAQCQALADETSLLGYTKPGPVTLRGLAPRLQHRVVSSGPRGEKTYAIIFGKGDEVLSGLTELGGTTSQSTRRGIRPGFVRSPGSRINAQSNALLSNSMGIPLRILPLPSGILSNFHKR
jgi:hypothetical protein